MLSPVTDDMTEMMKKLQKIGIIPTAALENAEDALPLAEQQAAGGLPCAEAVIHVS